MITTLFKTMLRLHKLPVLLMLTLLLFSGMQIAAETATETAAEAPAEEKKAPVEISPEDTTPAGKAKHAFKEANPCEGMAEGEYMGPEVCADCHQDKIETMKFSPHGQAADSRSPFGRQGCETCHGPGALHFETEGNCIISMTGRYGETVYSRNEISMGDQTGTYPAVSATVQASTPS